MAKVPSPYVWLSLFSTFVLTNFCVLLFIQKANEANESNEKYYNIVLIFEDIPKNFETHKFL